MFFWPKFLRKTVFKTQRVSVTWPKLLQLADQAKRGGSLTAMFFLHGYINDWWFWFNFCPIFKGKKCFCWCHTNTLGTILRRFPQVYVYTSKCNCHISDIAGIPQHCCSLLFTETGDFRPVGLTQVDHDTELVDHLVIINWTSWS